jgi:hypothetical protein
MSKWLYKGKEVNDIEDFGEQTPFGFVYMIGNTITGKIYIGKKFLQHKKTKKLGKKAIAEQTGPGRKKLKKLLTLNQIGKHIGVVVNHFMKMLLI